MAEVVVMTFGAPDEAARALKSLREVEQGGKLGLTDTAVVRKDETGKIHVDNELDSGVEMGIVGGSILGMLLNFIFPVAGLVIGAAGGALVGRSLGMGVDQNFVKDVSESLTPGSSALFLMTRSVSPDVVLAALRPYQGTLHHTSLSPEVEAELRRALE